MSNISFSGADNKPLVKLIDEFLNISGLKINKKVLLSEDKNQQLQSDFDIYIVPYGFKEAVPGRLVTYSLTDNRADAVLINIQNHPDSRSFEIMTDSSMGRVFINNKNKVSVETVLMCAAVFLGLDVDLSDILDVLNSILK